MRRERSSAADSPTKKEPYHIPFQKYGRALLNYFILIEYMKYTLHYNYQILTRFSGATYNGDSGVMPNASYQAAMCGRAPFTRHLPKE